MMIKNKKGFTLIELMLASMILVISIIPMTMMLPRIFTDNTSIEHTNRAVFLAQLKMEEMKTKVLTYFNHNYSENVTAFASPNNVFKYKITDNNDPNIKTITVEVWYDKINNNTVDTGEEYIKFITKVCNRGPGI